ncbi:hypothetical protein D3C75_824940 [compost metagenome]
MLHNLVIQRRRNPYLTDKGYGFGKLKQRFFLVREQRNLMPHTEQQNMVRIIAQLHQVLRMHIQAEGAAVDLGDPDFH